MPVIIDLTDRRFGRLKVLCRGEPFEGLVTWRCRCDCGAELDIRGFYLRDGQKTHCGCEVSVPGYSKTKEGQAWYSMMSRCRNPHAQNYKHYGGRGITVCARWNSFENFLVDMGEAPPGLSLERKDNNAGYSPDNCCWATQSEQAKNRRPYRRKSTSIRKEIKP